MANIEEISMSLVREFLNRKVIRFASYYSACVTNRRFSYQCALIRVYRLGDDYCSAYEPIPF